MDFINITSYILEGLNTTIIIYFFTLVLAMPLGLLCAMGKSTGNKIINFILDLYTWVFRGTPLLLQLVFIYFGLGNIGITFTPFVAAVLTFTLNYGAYFTEIFRGGIESIDEGQKEAAFVLGFNKIQCFFKIILPQSFKRVLPSLSNEAINLIKDTALVSTIGMGDMLRNAKEIVTRDFDIMPLFIAGIIYLVLTFIMVRFFKKLEKKYSYLN
ncbi:amino acid ABC transporter permease [Hathewaya limosa]|uniref:Polar amino acid transport system permease protein n=1 Tax=Hathewaya limosa TaxID=1536 RepID=A0ABU0JQ15_HATLI|nr:amino acid ABC transporter permease [Hathewaya limosa]MDQ0478510.1 polar amino acid transport system permease protein [Hathewaya limosa]